MALLFTDFDFPDMSRMTGIWINKTHDPDVGNEVALAQMIILSADQDPAVESDFLCSHLPFHIGGFHGVFADGQAWLVIIQKASAALSKHMVSATDPHWILVDGISRVLRYNAGAEAEQWATWDRDSLETYYAQQGVEVAVIASWSIAELLWGLLAECCNAPLLAVVQGYKTGCAFPNREHNCQADVFNDVFSLWTTLALAENDELETDQDEESSEEGFIRWTAHYLEKFSLNELHMMAREVGWESADIAGVPKEVLIKLMVTGQVIPPEPD